MFICSFLSLRRINKLVIGVCRILRVGPTGAVIITTELYRVPSGLPIKCGIFSLKMWEFNIALNHM